jgi:hypothetical protein
LQWMLETKFHILHHLGLHERLVTVRGVGEESGRSMTMWDVALVKTK